MKRIYEIEKKILFDADTCRLWPVGDPDAAITLYVPVSQCLLLLLQHPFETLSQEFFFEEVWRKNGLYVNANTLYQNIALLRKALKSFGIRQDIIKTIPRRGIKFTGSSLLAGDEALNKPGEPDDKKNRHLAVSKSDGKNWKIVTSGRLAAKKHRQKAALYLPFIIIIMMTGWLFTLLKPSETVGNNYFGRYYSTGLIGTCTLLSSSSDNEQSRHYFSVTSRLTGVNCSNNDYAWITFNDSNRKVSVVKCDSQITHDKANCATWIYREAGNE